MPVAHEVTNHRSIPVLAFLCTGVDNFRDETLTLWIVTITWSVVAILTAVVLARQTVEIFVKLVAWAGIVIAASAVALLALFFAALDPTY